MRPNPLTDELTDDAKAELAMLFAELKRHYPPIMHTPIGYVMRNRRQFWEYP